MLYHPERHQARARIESLDAKTDHQRIAQLSAGYNFPWDTQRAYELAMLRSFCVPHTATLLVKTEQFTKRTQKRYDDTTIIISEIGLYGYDSPRGRAAIARMNQLHARYAIPNHEYLYVLALFMLEPIYWNAKFGWRPLSQTEKEACYYFWFEVAKRMHIKDIPASWQAMEAYRLEYEAQHFQYHPNNRILLEACLELFLAWYLPKPLWHWGKQAVLCLFDRAMLDAFGYQPPAAWLRESVHAALRARAITVGWLPARKSIYQLPPTRTYGDNVAMDGSIARGIAKGIARGIARR